MVNVSLFAFASFVCGLVLSWVLFRIKMGGFKTIAADILKRAELESEILKKNCELSLNQKNSDLRLKIEEELQKERRKIQVEEERLKEREDKLERRLNLVEKKLSDIEKKETILITRKEQIEQERKELEQKQKNLLHQLEMLSGLSTTEAREVLLQQISTSVSTDAANYVRRVQKEAEEESEKIASSIIATAINRLATPCVSEISVITVPLPNEEMKARIIGREGRNVRALERATGINFLIDDTPGAVVLSGFDPIRKQIAKATLSELIHDGRIHPTRIEEAVEKATKQVQKQIRQYGEDAALRAGAINLHPELINLLGKLKFRYSYGQNVLDHSLEVSYLMGIMAAELGLEVALAKRIGLLHDIGKALSHEMEGSHAILGRDIALKFGESIEVANGIGCHHNEIEPITPEGSLCGSADRISASRPGARIEAVEEYIKRLKKLEDLAYEFPGVEKAYAMQAGREIRIVVLPEMINDDGIVNLARDLTKRIENELNYPGKIKVTVIREKRAIEYAV
jgi:ribonuclease Y